MWARIVGDNDFSFVFFLHVEFFVESADWSKKRLSVCEKKKKELNERKDKNKHGNNVAPRSMHCSWYGVAYTTRITSEFYQLKKEHFMHFHSSQSNRADLDYTRWRWGPVSCISFFFFRRWELVWGLVIPVNCRNCIGSTPTRNSRDDF